MSGRIHSIESFGTVDGPGVRLVVFLQGCPMRCAYCHNPDTWDLKGGKKVEVSRIIKDFERNRGFYRGGGITVTGGEPLLQVDFLIELFLECKKHEIHTCIDTSGITYKPENIEYIEKLDRLLELTDLVMLDIKHIDPEKHLHLTGQPNEGILAFAYYLSNKNIPVWIRHVVVPGLTDSDESINGICDIVAGRKCVERVELLPFHKLGEFKWRELGLDYKLYDTPAPTNLRMAELRAIIDKRCKRL